jgi:hypothetical protein
MSVVPTSDVSTTGWTATPSGSIFSVLDEDPYDDADYATSNVSGASALILGQSASLPANTHVQYVRASCSTGSTQIRVSLLDGANAVQGYSAWQTIDTTPTTYQLSVTTTGAATRVQIEIGVDGMLSLDGGAMSLDGGLMGLV